MTTITKLIVLDGGKGDYVFEVGEIIFGHKISSIERNTLGNEYIVSFNDGDWMNVSSTNTISLYEDKEK
ncbi:hypothetical protein [Ectobacillus polymachus]|uniref:hypothetical protein n=1 Tax=Ectobacillus polymachus TaxID=1508806 RepID=UPI003A873797